MRIPARTIWDTKIQCVCGVIAAREEGHTELYMCGNFGQVTLDPPRVVINPNRLYPIEGIIRRSGRFSLNVMPQSQREEVLRLVRMRRREPRKAELLGWALIDGSDMPALADSARTLFCEVEQALDSGDHTVFVARVTGVRENLRAAREPALLYGSIASDPGRFAHLRGAAGRLVPALRSLKRRLRPPLPADLPGETYRQGGQTGAEVDITLSYGVLDRGRILSPPPPPRAHSEPIGVCVAGTHWGALHCENLRRANPNARLYVCGRDLARAARLARRFGAEDVIAGLENAVADARVDAMVLALPHHLHASAAAAALAAGKHVLVEKPIATTLDEADGMAAQAARFGRILMVAEDMHFRPALVFVARRIAAGDIGEPLMMFARAGTIRRPEGWVADSEKLGGGVFVDIGIHYIRAMRLLLGEPHSVFAARPMQVNTKMSGEDSMTALFESRYGWQAHLTATWSALPGAGPDIVIAGEKGTFHLWPRARYVDFYPAAPTLRSKAVSMVRPYRLQEWLTRPGLQRVRLSAGGGDLTGYPVEMREFLAAILEGRPPVVTAEDARRDLELVFKAYESARSGVRVDIGAASAATQPR